MDIFKEYENLKQNTEFKKFQRDETNYYLVHVLIPDNNNSLEYGFYNPETDKITVFKTNPIEKQEEEDVFKEGKTIIKLDIDKVKLNTEEALKKIKEIQEKEFSAEKIKKKIILLQTIQNEPCWNITMVCESLNVINIRINAEK